jgi:hypothetical protein
MEETIRSILLPGRPNLENILASEEGTPCWSRNISDSANHERILVIHALLNP